MDAELEQIRKAKENTRLGAEWSELRAEWSELVAKLYNHPLVKGLSQVDVDGTSKKLPSYISSSTFAAAMIDILKEEAGRTEAVIPQPPTPTGTGAPPTASEAAVGDLRKAIDTLPSDKARVTLRALLDESVTDLDEARARLAS